MVAKLIVTLKQGMQKGLLHNQSSGVAACAKQIINLAGLAADSKYNYKKQELLMANQALILFRFNKKRMEIFFKFINKELF